MKYSKYMKLMKKMTALFVIFALLCGCGTSASAQKAETPQAAGGGAGKAPAAAQGAAPGEMMSASAQEAEDSTTAEKASSAAREALSEGAAEDASAASQESAAAFASGEVTSEKYGNNGGFFVRVDHKVYFRKYGQQVLENSALFSRFLDYSQPGGSSAMLAYDLETGEVTEVFQDPGYGRLFAGDGGFYCKKAGEGYGDIAYWVSFDGTKTVDIGQAVPLGITEEILTDAPEMQAGTGHTSLPSDVLDVKEDAAFLTLQDQDPDHAGDIFILHGGAETARAVRGADESLEYCGMTGEYTVYLACDMKKNTNCLYSLSGKTGESVCLGEMPAAKENYPYPYLEAEQFLSDEKGVYIVAANYQGTGHFMEYCLAVSAVPGTADSLQLIAGKGFDPGGETEKEKEEGVPETKAEDTGENSGMQEGEDSASQEEVNSVTQQGKNVERQKAEDIVTQEEESSATQEGNNGEEGKESSYENVDLNPLILFLTAPGKAEVVPGHAGTAGLSEGIYGDLAYYDSPYSALLLIPDFITKEQGSLSDNTDKKDLLDAEVIGDAVYVITAKSARNAAEDIGWRMAYELKELQWLRVPLSLGMPGSTDPAESSLLAQESYGQD